MVEPGNGDRATVGESYSEFEIFIFKRELFYCFASAHVVIFASERTYLITG